MKSVAQGGTLSAGESSGVRQAKLAFGCFAVLLMGLVGVVAQRESWTRSGLEAPAGSIASEPQTPLPAPVRADPSSGAGVTIIAKSADVGSTRLRPVPAGAYESVASAGSARSPSPEMGEAGGPSRELHETVRAPAPSAPEARERPAPVSASSGPVPSQATVALAVPRTVRVLGPLSFEVGSTRYRLQSSDGLGVSACSSRRAGRCFRRPRGDLKQAIAGATLQCRSLDRQAGEIVVACTKGTLSSLP